MKKTAFGFIAMGIASAVASAQSYIANEDFEGAKPTLEIGAQSRITDAKDEAIGGSRSLLCDAANGKDETAFEVSSDKFNVENAITVEKLSQLSPSAIKKILIPVASAVPSFAL